MGPDQFPPALKSYASQGSGTWALVVYENGVLLNNQNGSLPTIPVGIHDLRIYGSNSNYFNEGQYFRAYGIGTSGQWVEGPVTAYHRGSSQDAGATLPHTDAAGVDATARADAGSETGLPSGPAIVAMSVSDTSMQTDFASKLDNGVAPDGALDGAFQLTVTGPLSALILVTTDASGTTCCGQQWDTIVGSGQFPPELKSYATQGSGTWALVVYESGVLLNSSNGSLQTIASGTHKLTIYGSNSNYFNAGQYFRAYGIGTLEQWVEGPVIAY